MTIPNGTRVHVCGLDGLRWGTIEATWFSAAGAAHAYSILFDGACPGQGAGGGMAWIAAPLVTDISGLADRDPACFSAQGGLA